MEQSLAALALFAFVTSITPGPNNLMLMASGANFGIRRTMPHMLGISVGFAVLMIAVGLGLGALVTGSPVAGTALKAVCAVVLVWLSWRIATAQPAEASDGGGKPLTALQAAAFQWVNPKAWAMALGAVGMAAPLGGAAAIIGAAMLFAAVNIVSIAVWAVAGEWLAKILAGHALKRFNRLMALFLLATLWPLLAA